MKYTIDGFSQKAVLEYNKTHKETRLDLIDLKILRWFLQFSQARRKDNTYCMQTIKIGEDNTLYFRVKYEGVINEFPLFEINSIKAVANRFSKYIKGGILQGKVIKGGKESGTQTYFSWKGEYNFNEDEYNEGKETGSIKEGERKFNYCEKESDKKQTYYPYYKDPITISNPITIHHLQENASSKVKEKEEEEGFSYYSNKTFRVEEGKVKELYGEWQKLGNGEDFYNFKRAYYQSKKDSSRLNLSDEEMKTAIKNYVSVYKAEDTWWSTRQSFCSFCKKNIYRFTKESFNMDSYRVRKKKTVEIREDKGLSQEDKERMQEIERLGLCLTPGLRY